ncbi:G protein-regulated inducer of neurite outgrowth 3 [Zootoca vivipara]|uniref:G protein-regulated inducer of neurite outgrowth 3 n=1 Tax=Zootoca vivipara TaxID=8524 RepID=UPI00293B9779|nr:G protein-regulated inducer of neurite outgrowth 3 [Zootoca vivipara]
MGTVPDPLRSAKRPLVTTSEEENDLKRLQSSKHQHKQASIESNSNGFPFNAKVQPAGDRLLEGNCGAEADAAAGERHCGYDTGKPRMFSPGSSSPSKEDCLAVLEPGNNSEQESSSDAGAQGQDPAKEHAAVKAPATQEAKEIVPSGAGGQLCCAADKASSLPGGGGRVTESRAHGRSPPPSDAQQAAPTTKEIVGERIGPEVTQVPDSAKELEPVSDLVLKAHSCSDAEPKGSKEAGSDPGSRTAPEMVPKPSLGSTPQPSCGDKAAEKVGPEPSEFKDTGTMMVQPEGRVAGEEVASRTHQDAGVQAVATMESRSASTSPSIFAAFLRENMPPQATRKQDQLHIIYTVAGGKEQSEIVDDFAALVQTAVSAATVTEAHIQAAAAVDGGLAVQAVKLQESTAGTHDTAHSTLSGNATYPCPPASGSVQETSSKVTEAQTANAASHRSDACQQPPDTSVLLKTAPIYQITVNGSASPHPASSETKLPPPSALPGINSKPQHLGPSSAAESQQAPPASCGISEQDKAHGTAGGTPDSGCREQLRTETVRSLETVPASLHVDVKPKGEGKPVPLSPKEQGTTNAAGAATAPPTVCAPATAKIAQDKLPGKEAGGFGSRNLEAESGLSRNSGPGLGTKSNRTKKGEKGNLSASPALPLPKLGEKKKEGKSATEGRGHLKQSKRVRDVVWDEQGMTWEVYGASLDPESLGVAIQNHLQRQIREHEKLIKAQNSQTRKSVSSDTSSNRKLKGRQHSVFQSMMQNFRRPNCCVRPAASSVLD